MMHPTSGAHPSHRWFHTDEGEWRCACGADPNAAPDSHRHHLVSMPCVQRCAVDIENNHLFSHAENQIAHALDMSMAWSMDMAEMLGHEIEWKGQLSEYERCEWAGHGYEVSNYQTEIVAGGRFNRLVRQAMRNAELAEINHNSIMTMKSFDGNTTVTGPLNRIVKQYHQTGGIVRHGCEERNQ